MQAFTSRNKIFLALCLNAAALLMILFVVLSHDTGPSMTPMAIAQSSPTTMSKPNAVSPAAEFPAQMPVAGGDGLFVMPAQLSPNTWGCYLMDVNNQTLSVYQYSPGEKMLRLNAARNIKYDRQLGNFNTFPPPMEMKDLVDREQEMQRSLPTVPAPKPTETSKEQ